MHPDDECGRPYEKSGDIRPCPLHFNHGGRCEDANREHDAFIDSLHERTWQAQGPWL